MPDQQRGDNGDGDSDQHDRQHHPTKDLLSGLKVAAGNEHCESFSLSSLPEDTIQLFFSYLDLQDLLRLSETTTGWKTLTRRTRSLSTFCAGDLKRPEIIGMPASSASSSSALFSPDRRSRLLFNNDRNSYLRERFEHLRQNDLRQGFRVWAERVAEVTGTTPTATGASNQASGGEDNTSQQRELRRLCWLPLVLNDMFAHLTCLKINRLAPYQLRALTIINQCASAATLVELELRDCRFLCPARLLDTNQARKQQETRHQQRETPQRQRLRRPRLKRPRPKFSKTVVRPSSNRPKTSSSLPDHESSSPDRQMYYEDDDDSDDEDYDADNVGLRLRNNNGRLRHFVLSGCVFTFNPQPSGQVHQQFLESFFLQPGLETLVLDGYRTLEDNALASALAERKRRRLPPFRHMQLIRCSQLRQPNLMGSPTSTCSPSEVIYAPSLGLLESLVVRESPNLLSLWPLSMPAVPPAQAQIPLRSTSSISSNGNQSHSLSSFAHLHHVDVSFCPELTSETVESLLLRLNNLRTLLMRGCAKLSHIRTSSSPSLRELDVTLCANLTALELQNCNALQKLQVGHCLSLEAVSISSKSLSHTLNLSCLRRLQKLVLCLPSLMHLDLSGCESLTDEETILLLGPALKEVNLCGSFLTRNAVKIAVENDGKFPSTTTKTTCTSSVAASTGTTESAVDSDSADSESKHERRRILFGNGRNDLSTVVLHETGQPTRHLPIV